MDIYEFVDIFKKNSYGRVGLHTKVELEEMVDRMESSQLHTINYTDNELVKDHLRHLVLFSYLFLLSRESKYVCLSRDQLVVWNALLLCSYRY